MDAPQTNNVTSFIKADNSRFSHFDLIKIISLFLVFFSFNFPWYYISTGEKTFMSPNNTFNVVFITAYLLLAVLTFLELSKNTRKKPNFTSLSNLIIITTLACLLFIAINTISVLIGYEKEVETLTWVDHTGNFFKDRFYIDKYSGYIIAVSPYFGFAFYMGVISFILFLLSTQFNKTLSKRIIATCPSCGNLVSMSLYSKKKCPQCSVEITHQKGSLNTERNLKTKSENISFAQPSPQLMVSNNRSDYTNADKILDELEERLIELQLLSEKKKESEDHK